MHPKVWACKCCQEPRSACLDLVAWQDATCLGSCRWCPGRHLADEATQVFCCSIPRPALQVAPTHPLQAGKKDDAQLQWELLPSLLLPAPT